MTVFMRDTWRGTNMIKAELRTKQLLEMLHVNKRMDVKTVADSLKISEATTRRFFSQLEKQGKVIRIHGGVQLAPQLGYDYSYRVSMMYRQQEKAMIGRAAAGLVEENDRIFLDSGTTVLKLSEALSMKLQTGSLKNLVVLTNSFNHIATVARLCKVILIGGEVRVERRDVCGPVAEKNLMMFHTDKAFLGADAISFKGGLMTTDERTASINEMIVERADRVYVLADSDKFHKTSFMQYASFRDVEAIYTDNGIDRDTVQSLKKAGTRVEIVQE